MADKSTQLGIAQVPIRGDLGPLDKDLDKAKEKIDKSLSGVWKKIGGKVANIGKKAVIGGAGALAAAGAGVSIALGKMALDALPVQGVADAFAGITGNAEEALATLREGSLGMVRDAELMESYNSAAQLVGKTFADQLPGAMGYLSKVSAATGQDMGFMIDSLVKGVGRLSPMILDNLGIQVQLSDATARAAEMFGVEEDALSKAQIQAGMMDVVLQKLGENTADMPEVAGTAAQQWAALGVTMQNFKDRIGLALIPVLQKVLEPLGELISTHGPALVELFETRLVPALETLGMAAAQVLSGDLAGGLETLFGPEVAANIMGVLDTLRQVAGFIGANLGPILAGLAAAVLVAVVPAFVSWATAAGAAAIATVTAAAPVLAVIAAIGLAVGLLVAVWQNDWGGIRTTITDFWEGTGRPVLETLREWLAEKLTIALQTLSSFWTNTLQPALQGVWSFLHTYVLPILVTLGDVVILALGIALTVLAALWEKTLKPALESVWKFFNESIIPILKSVTSLVQEKVGPALLWLKEKTIDALTGALGGLKSALGWVNDRLNDLKNALSNLHLPAWLTPGSPTPLETGVRGISSAVQQLAGKDLVKLESALGSDRMMGAGRAWLDGFVQGVDDKTAELYDRAAKVVTNMKSIMGGLQDVAGYQGAGPGLGAAVDALIADARTASIRLVAYFKTWTEQTSKNVGMAGEAGGLWGKLFQPIRQWADGVKAVAGYVAAEGLAAAVDALIADARAVSIRLVAYLRTWTEGTAENVTLASEAAATWSKLFQPLRAIPEGVKAFSGYTAAQDLGASVDALIADARLVSARLVAYFRIWTDSARENVGMASEAGTLWSKLFAPLRAIPEGVKLFAGYVGAQDLGASVDALIADARAVSIRLVSYFKLWADSTRENVGMAGEAATLWAKLFAPQKTIADGVKAFTDYRPARGLAAAVDALIADARAVSIRLVSYFKLWSESTHENVGLAAEAAAGWNKLFAPVKGVVDGVKAIFDLPLANESQFGRLTDTLAGYVERFTGSIRKVSERMDSETMGAMAEWSQGAGSVLNMGKTAVDFFTGLGKWKLTSSQRMDFLAGTMELFLDDVLLLKDLFGPEVMDAATLFATQAETVFSKLQTGVALFDELNKGTIPSANKITAFMTAYGQLGAALASGGAAAGAGAVDLETSAPPMGKGGVGASAGVLTINLVSNGKRIGQISHRLGEEREASVDLGVVLAQRGVR